MIKLPGHNVGVRKR